jgi:hypothetical protein
MKYKTIVCLTVILLAGSANAYLGWVPTVYDANEVSPVGNWNVVANWFPDAADPDQTLRVPTTADEARFANSAIPCLIDAGTDAVCLQIKMGDNGGNDLLHQLTIQGSLTTSTPDSWSSVGYNRASILNVERGASFINGYRVGIGLVATTNTSNAPSVLNVNGGLVTMAGSLQIGYVASPTVGHIGIVNVNSGILEANSWEWRDTAGNWSFMDIGHGTVYINADVTGAIPGLISSGALTGFGGAGTLNYAYANGKTTITSTDPLARTPKMDAVVPVGDVDLSWINVGTSPVYVAVYFGTDPANLTRVTDPNTSIDTTTLTVNAPVTDEYIWRVDTYDSTPGTDPNDPIIGDTMYFFASDDAAPTVVMDTVPMATWIDEPVQLNITVTDDGKSPVTFLWDSSDPNAVFSPSNTVEDPTVSMDYLSGLFTVAVTVSDGNPLGLTDTASVSIYCASSPCAAARAGNGMNLAVAYPADIVPDCMHDLADFARLASEWQLGYAPTEPQVDTR